MKIMIKIGMILLVLLSMVGSASAAAEMRMGPSLELNTVPGGSVTWNIYMDLTGTDAFTAQTIDYDTMSTEVNAILATDSVTGPLATTTIPIPLGQTGSIGWTPTGEGTYNFTFTATVANTPSLYTYPLYVHATGISLAPVPSLLLDLTVPEFPAIALPVAAILGLAFIFQRRREED